MSRWSLRLRLTLLTSGLLCVALVAGALALTTVLSRSRTAALDVIVVDRARTVAALALDDRLPPTLPITEPGEAVQLLDAEGRVITSSPNTSRTLPLLPAGDLAVLRVGSDPAEPRVTTAEVTAYSDPARVAVIATDHLGEPVTVVAAVPLKEVRGLLQALRIALVVVVPLLTALLAGAIWLVLGRALHPVEQLRRAAAQVARTGGPGSLPVPATQDELGALATTLNEMLDRLEVAAAGQRRFVADAAHELRSPLASLRAGLEVAIAHPGATTDAGLAAELAPEVLRMGALVDDLLLLARVGSAPVSRTDVDLARVAREAVRAAVPDRVAVTVTGVGRAHGDEAALTRVVRNLVENAARHATDRVEVTVSPGAVTVADDGAGIAEADRARVFERFVRLDEARERESGGSGLGLAIAREIARAHGGDVELGSGPLGGLTAVLRLPETEPDDEVAGLAE